MLREKKIGFIGSGNMGEALISGLVLSKAAKPENIICSDIAKDLLENIQNKYKVSTTTDNIEVARQSEIVIYATKPQILGSVLKETAGALDQSKLIISIAAGVPLAAIAAGLHKKLRLIRVMPNICAFVKESATAIAAGEFASDKDVAQARAIFDSVGKTVFIQENVLMDAFTGLSGSGPAYIFTIIDAMADGGVKMGLSRKDSLFLSTQTVLGAAKLLLESKEHPGQLKDRVASPGGTAIAGIHTLEQGGLRTTMINAVESATKRSKELGDMMVKDFIKNNKKSS
ncbi:MAG: pyrroline-5-carboxylate reductase [Desulfobacula sp.]|jgi:pyrroline-5-carboxylate reductase|uniref:pyrroline-5-carboxylate reductase n=1 Tax=Desulfobacula sp. TaxID=2593537 RepID=UPI001E18529A|nr:pyrroline-5-carboxylate reductase [Desulfobacula sp.]MBT3485291.1 pyrroline-5-carboxylate reductase [Desulfobacula sp.]MBT3803649.1 pyrroline-5-carboxylate reductase [Desulfobacula sp.]MBT4024224.1 pyrroline-5-carboxylate reductase [Desulfobacula sp.]MBT4199300.1 pyrroline-5-carboxylate reductase [Desulfobacula sp.]